MAEEYILVVDDEEVLCDVLSYNLRCFDVFHFRYSVVCKVCVLA